MTLVVALNVDYRIRTLRKYALVFVVLTIGVVLATVYLSNSPAPHQVTINAKENPDSGKISEAEMERLASLPYTNWSNDRTDVSKFGVTRHNLIEAHRGLNFFNSRNLSRAHLMDMQGRIVHTWAVPKAGANSWHTIQLRPNGDLLAIVKDDKLIRLAWNSKVKWEFNAAVHHDVAVSSDNFIYVLTRRPGMWRTREFSIPIVKEYITVLSENGTVLKEIGLFEVLSPLISQERIKKIQTWAATEDIPARIAKKGVPGATWWENKKADAFHINSIFLIERDVPGLARKGDLLLSVRQLDLICIFRPAIGELVWSWGPGQIECQHHATLLENNNILLFDNGCERRSSRVIEVDPTKKEIAWEYKVGADKQFFSHRRGAAQRLGNGNTLITESDRGRVFEVNREGQIVWEYWNEDVSSAKKRRAVVYRMIRLPENFVQPGKQ